MSDDWWQGFVWGLWSMGIAMETASWIGRRLNRWRRP